MIPFQVSILLMVPVYAWASALKLLLPGPTFAIERQLLDTAKECYEVPPPLLLLIANPTSRRRRLFPRSMQTAKNGKHSPHFNPTHTPVLPCALSSR
jgi:electron transfer flavoprotein alpha/beta subunit